MMKTALVVIGLLVLLGLAAMAVFVFVVQNVEQPRYETLVQDGPFELRDYPSLLAAEVRRQGSRREALSAGFGPLAGYIFAKDREGERISMTAPVTQAPAGSREWTVRFFMPAGYDLNRLPRPAGSDVRLIEVPPRRMAVIRFSGIAFFVRRTGKWATDFPRKAAQNRVTGHCAQDGCRGRHTMAPSSIMA